MRNRATLPRRLARRLWPLAWLACWLAFPAWTHAAEAGWQPGLTRTDVVRLMGPPRSTTQIGGREYLYYPDNVRIEIQRGGVTAIEGRVPDALRPPGAAPSPAAPAASAAAATGSAPDAAPPTAAAAPVATTSPTASAPPPQTSPSGPAPDEDVLAVEQLADPAVAFGTAPGQPLLPRLLPGAPDGTVEDGDVLSGAVATGMVAVVLAFLAAGFLVKVLVQMVILKVAFHFVGFPGLWRDMIKVAFASNIVGLLLEGLLLLIGEDWRMVYEAARVGPLLNLALLVALILKLTDVKQLGTALSIALATALLPLVALLVGGSFVGSFSHWLSSR